MCRHSHDSACTITGKNVVAYPHRYVFTCKRIHCIRTRKHTGHFLVDHSLTLCLVLYRLDILIDFCTLFRSSKHVYIFAFRCQHHESHTHHCIGTCSKYFHHYILVAGNRKLHFCTLATADPVTLSFFQ